MTFINSGIYTQYGLDRINEIVYGKKNTLNFSKIKIGDANGNILTLDVNLDKLIHPVYVLPIENVILGNDVTTFITTLPSYIQGFCIREIGIYETINGQDYLFAVSCVNSYKPSDIDYDLIIEIHDNLNISNIPYDLITIGINPAQYVTPSLIASINDDYLNNIRLNFDRCITEDYAELVCKSITRHDIALLDFDSITNFDDLLDLDALIESTYINIDPSIINNLLIDPCFSTLQQFKYKLTNLTNIDCMCKLRKFLNNLNARNEANSSNAINFDSITNFDDLFDLDTLQQSKPSFDITMGCFFNNNNNLTNYIIKDLSLNNNNITVSNANILTIKSPNLKMCNSIGDLPFTLNLNMQINDLFDCTILKCDNFFNLYIKNKVLYFTLYSDSTNYYMVPCELEGSICNKFRQFTLTYNGDKDNPISDIFIDSVKVSGIKINKNFNGLNNFISNSTIKNFDSMIGIYATLLPNIDYSNIVALSGCIEQQDIKYLIRTLDNKQNIGNALSSTLNSNLWGYGNWNDKDDYYKFNWK